MEKPVYEGSKKTLRKRETDMKLTTLRCLWIVVRKRGKKQMHQWLTLD